MEIRGKVHLMFEQSGVFKNEFKKLGYEAFDYDIQNEFNETDLIDNNRTLRGDDFVKPTGYWFFNCEPTFGCSLEPNKKIKTVCGSKPSSRGGM